VSYWPLGLELKHARADGSNKRARASHMIKTLSALCDNTALLAILSARPDFGKQCL
jgi:hypothetical protein